MFDWLTQNKITIYHSVPTVFRQLLPDLHVQSGPADLRLLVLSGEPVLKTDVALFAQMFSQDCIMANSLGMTEATSLRWNFIDHETHIQGNSVPVGYDFSFGTQIFLVDENLAEVGFNRIGQIAVRSRYLSPGYWNNPDLTRAAFLDDPDCGDMRIFLTGDLGQMHENGCLEHLGRMDSQVKVRGFRVELSEIENALVGLDTIREVVVAADGHDFLNNQKLIAYFVPVDDQSPPAAGDLRRILKDTLPDYMIPSTFVILDSLPKSHGGKIDRNYLPGPGRVRPGLNTPFMPPRSLVEQVLAGIWAQVLMIDRMGRNDDFLDLGGDSLLAAALLVQVEESFGEKPPLAALIEASTVAQMAKILRHERWRSSDSSPAPIQPKGDKPPFFCIHGEGGHVLGMAGLARRLGEDQPFYGLESAGRDGELKPLTRIEAMATSNIDEIRTVQPEGPYLLGGYSMGGVVAF